MHIVGQFDQQRAARKPADTHAGQELTGGQHATPPTRNKLKSLKATGLDAIVRHAVEVGDLALVRSLERIVRPLASVDGTILVDHLTILSLAVAIDTSVAQTLEPLATIGGLVVEVKHRAKDSRLGMPKAILELARVHVARGVLHRALSHLAVGIPLTGVLVAVWGLHGVARCRAAREPSR
jgi:hypothetical protein